MPIAKAFTDWLKAACSVLTSLSLPECFPKPRKQQLVLFCRYVRMPGGCYVEGVSLQDAYWWKPSVGPIQERPGHYNGPWQYWSTDGMILVCPTCSTFFELSLIIKGFQPMLGYLLGVSSSSWTFCMWLHIWVRSGYLGCNTAFWHKLLRVRQ